MMGEDELRLELMDEEDSDSSESLGTPSPSPREEVNRISPFFVGVGFVVALCSFLGPKG